MLTHSTSSWSTSDPSDSTSLTAQVDLDVVEEIFHRGRDATSFPQIFGPYTEVLQERGISPTSDSVYYSFLLKVGVIKAQRWADKWAIWKEARETVQAAGTPPRSPFGVSRSPATHLKAHSPLSSPGSRGHSSSLAEVKSRVPFLTSASSDLDEGYDDNPPIIAQTGRDAGYNSFVHGRPSPRKEMHRSRREIHRSMVGYTPDQSLVDRVDASFTPPMRTSTPVFARTPRYQQAGRPSAYSLSDVDQIVDQSTEDLTALGLSTPKGSAIVLPSTSPTWYDRLEELPERDRRAMERKAGDFYALGLMGRCWDMWTKTSEFYRVAYRNIPVARDNLLLRQLLERWSQATRRQLTHANTAEQHRSLQLKEAVLRRWQEAAREHQLGLLQDHWSRQRDNRHLMAAFHRWKAAGEKKRTDRWKMDMADKELRFSERRDGFLVRRILKRWRIETRARIATTEANRRTCVQIFDQWYGVTTRKQTHSALLDLFTGHKLAGHLTQWRKKTVLAPLEMQVEASRNHRLMRSLFGRWRLSARQNQQSTLFDRRRRLLSVMDGWKDAVTRQKRLARRAVIFDEMRLLHHATRQWKLESWSRLLLSAREKRIQSKTWDAWADRHARVGHLNDAADSMVAKRETTRIQVLFSRWRASASTRARDALHAQLVHDKNRRSKVLTKWHEASKIIRVNSELAGKAHAYFLLRTAFGAWRRESAVKIAQHWVEQREQRAVRGVFERWLGMAARYQDLSKRESVYQQYTDKRVLKERLDQWTGRVVEVKDRELRVARAYDERVLDDTFSRWRDRAATIRSNQMKADDSQEIRQLEGQRRILRVWRYRAKRERRLRLMGDTSVQARDQRLVREAFEVWYERKRGRELAAVEDEVAFLHENVILYGVMDRWKAATEILPGISANATRLKTRTMRTWLAALQKQRHADRLRAEREQKLISEVFEVWRNAAERKAALHARRVRSRTRPSYQPEADRRVVSGSEAGPKHSPPARRITPTSPPLPLHARERVHARQSLLQSRSRDRDEAEHRSETVYSEPVYSRLRSELGLGAGSRPRAETRKRGGSEELEVPPQHGDARPRSGSEMLRALRGTMTGR
ncbi:hypothetical protein IAU60_004778 [Kwoniella sp. DSM 27419]